MLHKETIKKNPSVLPLVYSFPTQNTGTDWCGQTTTFLLWPDLINYMLQRISHIQIRVSHITNLCFQPDRVCLYAGTLNTLGFEKKLKEKYLPYETEALNK